MTGTPNRVAITGMGILAANGIGLDHFWDSLILGESGIGPITLFDAEGLKCQIAGEVPDFVAEEWIDPCLKPKRMARFTQMAVTAAELALKDAHLDDRMLKHQDHVPIVLGVSTNAMDLIARDPSTTTAVSAIPHAATSAVGYLHNIQTKLITISNGCASSVDAIAHAANLIRVGASDVAIAGGAESSMSRYTFECMLRTKRCTTRNEDPKRASRPFDRDRDRGVMAEGSAVLVLENYEHAMARGKKVYATIAGYASYADERNGNEGNGLVIAMKRALSDARISPRDIDYICAHGPSDLEMDVEEIVRIKEVFGDHAYTTPVSSIKGVTGCAMGAGGGHQLVAAALALDTGIIPPTANYEFPDPDCDLDIVPNTFRRNEIVHALVNTHGFGRGNSCVVLEKAGAS